MAQDNGLGNIRTFNQGPKTFELRKVIEDLINDFKSNAVTGSIELHFFNGAIGKVKEIRVHG